MTTWVHGLTPRPTGILVGVKCTLRKMGGLVFANKQVSARVGWAHFDSAPSECKGAGPLSRLHAGFSTLRLTLPFHDCTPISQHLD